MLIRRLVIKIKVTAYEHFNYIPDRFNNLFIFSTSVFNGIVIDMYTGKLSNKYNHYQAKYVYLLHVNAFYNISYI